MVPLWQPRASTIVEQVGNLSYTLLNDMIMEETLLGIPFFTWGLVCLGLAVL